MRLIKPLFMLVIGMIASTAFASTPMPGENQKATFEKEAISFTMVADVQPIYVLTLDAGTMFINGDVFTVTSRKIVEPSKQYAVLADVGWHIDQGFYKTIHYVEKLTNRCLFDHEKNLQKIGIPDANKRC